MAKKSKRVNKSIPEGMKCYQKTGGGSLRFGSGVSEGRIIKTGQKFWIYPELLPKSFKDVLKEVPEDNKAVIIDGVDRPKVEGKKEKEQVPEKFEMVKAVDEDGEAIKKGNSNLYNVLGEDGNPLNDKPLRKGKAEELLETLNS